MATRPLSACILDLNEGCLFLVENHCISFSECIIFKSIFSCNMLMSWTTYELKMQRQPVPGRVSCGRCNCQGLSMWLRGRTSAWHCHRETEMKQAVAFPLCLHHWTVAAPEPGANVTVCAGVQCIPFRMCGLWFRYLHLSVALEALPQLLRHSPHPETADTPRYLQNS